MSTITAAEIERAIIAAVWEPVRGDVVEVASEADAVAFRLRVGRVQRTVLGTVAHGVEINQRGIPVRPRSFPLYAGVTYAVMPARRAGQLGELLFGRAGRRRRR